MKSGVKLSATKPQEQKAKETSGNLKRSELSEIYQVFIDSHLDTVKDLRYFEPMTYLIFSGKDKKISFFPLIQGNKAKRKDLDNTISTVMKSFDMSGDQLELIIYSQEATPEDNLKKNKQNEKTIIFGARDIDGTTIHSFYKAKYNKQEIDIEETNEIKGANVWFPNTDESGISDQMLDMLMKRIAIANSMINLEK